MRGIDGGGIKGSANVLFRRLPAAERALLKPHLEPFTLEPDAIVCAAGDRIHHAVFPLSGIISMVALTGEGSVLHGGVVGQDGMFGLPLSVGLQRSSLEARVQGRGECIRIESRPFRRLLGKCPVFGMSIQRHALRMLDQLSQIAVCNCHHTIEERTARSILSTSDRMRSDVISLKQSALAEMLGVLRPSISQAASAFRAAGLLDYRRGEIRIVKRSKLEALACSCYPRIAASYAKSIV